MSDETAEDAAMERGGTPLSAAARRALRAQAHALSCRVTIGKAGLTPAVIEQVRSLLARSPLLKIRLPKADRAESDLLCAELARKTQSQVLARIGFTATILREGATHADGDVKT